MRRSGLIVPARAVMPAQYGDDPLLRLPCQHGLETTLPGTPDTHSGTGRCRAPVPGSGPEPPPLDAQCRSELERFAQCAVVGRRDRRIGVQRISRCIERGELEPVIGDGVEQRPCSSLVPRADILDRSAEPTNSHRSRVPTRAPTACDGKPVHDLDQAALAEPIRSGSQSARRAPRWSL